MNVLLVTEYYPPKVFGGGELSAWLLAKHLAAKGIDVNILTAGFEGLAEFEEKAGVKIYRRLKTGDNPHSILQNLKRQRFTANVAKLLPKVCEELDIDVVHCLSTPAIAGAALARKKGLDVPVVATINSYVNLCPKGNLFYKEKSECSGCSSFGKYLGCIKCSHYIGKAKVPSWLRLNPVFFIPLWISFIRRRNALKCIDKLVAVSGFVQKTLKNHGHDSSIVHTIFEPEHAGKVNAASYKGRTVVFIASTLEKIKGIDILIKGFKQSAVKDAVLLIAGEGPEEKNLKMAAVDDKRIVFLGKLDYAKTLAYYKVADVVALMGLWPEPFSRTGLEALYYGKPLLATAVGGNRDVVVDGVTGVLCKPDVDAVAEALKELLENPSMRAKMGIAARKLFNEKFSQEKAVRGIIKAYEGLLT